MKQWGSALKCIEEKDPIVFKIADGLYIVCNQKYEDAVYSAVSALAPKNKSILGSISPKELFKKLSEAL